MWRHYPHGASITSQGLFGIKYRPKGQDSPLTNDITSSSTFGQDGTVNIDTPGTDPGKDTASNVQRKQEGSAKNPRATPLAGAER